MKKICFLLIPTRLLVLLLSSCQTSSPPTDIPDDENSLAKGTFRINSDPIREYQGIEFTPGTYRVHIDDKIIDIVLEVP